MRQICIWPRFILSGRPPSKMARLLLLPFWLPRSPPFSTCPPPFSTHLPTAQSPSLQLFYMIVSHQFLLLPAAPILPGVPCVGFGPDMGVSWGPSDHVSRAFPPSHYLVPGLTPSFRFQLFNKRAPYKWMNNIKLKKNKNETKYESA